MPRLPYKANLIMDDVLPMLSAKTSYRRYVYIWVAMIIIAEENISPAWKYNWTLLISVM